MVKSAKKSEKDGSIKRKIIGLSVIAIFVVIAFQSFLGIYQFNKVVYSDKEQILKSQVELESKNLAQEIIDIGKVCRTFASNVEAIPTYDQDIIFSLFAPFVESTEMVVGGGVWFEPYYLNSQEKYYGPYLSKNNGELEITWVYSNEEYDYFGYDWYKNGLNSEKDVIFSEPYLDIVSGIVMLTLTSPVKKDGVAIGVTTIDIDINTLAEYVRNIKVGKNGYAFVLTGEGYYLGNKTESKDLTERITEDQDEEISKLGQDILANSNIGVKETSFNGTASYVSYAPIGDTGMKLVTIMPRSEVAGTINFYILISIVCGFIAIILLSSVLYVLLTKKLINPLQAIVKNTELIASGDLTTKGMDNILAEGEIKTVIIAFNAMVENIKMTINKLQERAIDLARFSTELTASAESVAAGANETTNSITEVAAATEQVTSNTNNIVNLSKEATDYTTKGTTEIKKVAKHMDNIQESTNANMQVINNLSKSASQISQIVELITGIASQTNLLALNATIEAARAGTLGRGFAVVADEVKNLARRSAKAANEIQELISGIQQEIQQTVDTMRQNEAYVQEGSRVVNEAENVFGQIYSSIEALTNEIHSVASAIEQISASIQNVASAAEEQTATMEEVSATSQNLAMIATEMDNLSAKFKI